MSFGSVFKPWLYFMPVNGKPKLLLYLLFLLFLLFGSFNLFLESRDLCLQTWDGAVRVVDEGIVLLFVAVVRLTVVASVMLDLSGVQILKLLFVRIPERKYSEYQHSDAFGYQDLVAH